MPDVSNPPGLAESGDVDHDETQGGTEGNPHSQSADANHGNESHSSAFAVDGSTQPPESHGNGAHTSTFAVDGATQPPESHGNGAHTQNYSSTAGGVVIEDTGPAGSPSDPKTVLTAGGDVLLAADDGDAIIRNESTGVETNPNFASAGETISWYSGTNARLVRTEER